MQQSHTELQVRYTDFDTIDLSTEKQKILEILTEDSIHEDVYGDLVHAFSDGQAGLNVDPVYCLQLIEKITALFPNANFECRGLGEEYFYTWILCVENGQIIFSSKPWETENPFI
ncbi:hypothetical protein [Acinetobacter pittii]|uniref:hypothetical protein n=1 Tax=Acinetobacter pittii TaxID=48296 RepID=UPI0024DEA2CF|nr:hypothetical protein [Acinetobacter pittii]